MEGRARRRSRLPASVHERAAGLRRPLGVERDLERRRSSSARSRRRSCPALELQRGLLQRLLALGSRRVDLLAAAPSSPGLGRAVGVRRGLAAGVPPPESSSRAAGGQQDAGEEQREEAGHGAAMIMRPRAALPRLALATTTCCSTSTAASGSATSPRTRAPEAVAALREAGKGVALPHQRRPPRARGLRAQAVAARLPGRARRGASPSARRCSTCSPQRTEGGAAFVVGSQALVDHVADGGDADRQQHGVRLARRASSSSPATTVFDYARAARSPRRRVLRGAELIGTTRDATFPMPDGAWPGTGAVLAAVETAAGRRADRIVGKPEPAMYEAARDRLGPGPHPRGRRPARHRRRGRRGGGPGLGARAHRRDQARRGDRRAARAEPRRGVARGARVGLEAPGQTRRAGGGTDGRVPAPVSTHTTSDSGVPGRALARGAADAGRPLAPRAPAPEPLDGHVRADDEDQGAEARDALDRRVGAGRDEREHEHHGDEAQAPSRTASTASTAAPTARAGPDAGGGVLMPKQRGESARAGGVASCALRRDACLIVNPNAGGGRARAAARRSRPRSPAGRRASASSARRRSSTPASSRRRAPRRGEIAAAMGGDGLIGAVAGRAARRPAASLAVLPGGRGNDFARKLGIAARPRGGRAPSSPAGASAPSTSRDVDGRTVPRASPRAGFDSDANRSPTRRRLPLGGARLRSTATLRALARWKPARWEVTRRRRAPRRSPATPSPSRTRACTAAACTSCPTPRSTTACSTSCSSSDMLARALPRPAPARSSRAPTSTTRASTCSRAARSRFDADRPFTAYADGDPIADLPATVRVAAGRAAVLAP